MQFLRAVSHAVTQTDALQLVECDSDDDLLTMYKTRRHHQLNGMPQAHAKCTVYMMESRSGLALVPCAGTVAHFCSTIVHDVLTPLEPWRQTAVVRQYNIKHGVVSIQIVHNNVILDSMRRYLPCFTCLLPFKRWIQNALFRVGLHNATVKTRSHRVRQRASTRVDALRRVKSN